MRTFFSGVIAVLLVGSAGWFLSRPAHDASETTAEVAEAEVAGRQSEPPNTGPALLPSVFGGIALGDALDAVRTERGITAPEHTELGVVYVEPLSDDARAVYIFRDDQLAAVQHLRQTTAEAAADLLRETIERLGSPDSSWTCAGENGAPLPTQRLVWQRGSLAAQEILLVHPTGVSITFIASSQHETSQSLRRSSCRPMTSPADLASPATNNQLRNAASMR